MEAQHAKEALDRVDGAADAAETAATRLQMKTDSRALDADANQAKDLVHGAREAAEDLKEDLAAGATSEAAAAKVAEAAAAVEQELKDVAQDIAEELEQATGTGATPPPGRGLRTMLSTRRSTEQAVRELEMLAEKKAANSVPGRHIFMALWALWALVLLAIIFFKDLFGNELLWSSTAGLVGGVAASFLYHYNRRWKYERNQRLGMIPGAKGIQAMAHHIPSWISFRDTEKMEWLNKILAKAWPYYDAAICEEVKAQVEPLMDQYRPPGISRIYFKKLTFGDAPFRVEGIRVDDSLSDRVQMDIDFRWAGDANIFLAVELPAGGGLTRMVPKVSDMAVSGTLRVILSPLLPEIPGFGAATISLMRPPVVKFHLDFGAAFGGSYTAKAIVAWLDPFLRSTVTGMLVWPRRIVVPILGEEITGPLDDLFLRHKGAFQIDIVSAKDLPRMDVVGKGDPYVEIYTTSDMVEKTTVKKNTLNPVWNERLWLLVQEPSTQAAFITVNDVDFINLKELFKINLVKGAASVFNATSLIGRNALKVEEFAARPGQEIEKWVPLGMGDFNDEDGCGGGRGELQIRATYWPLEQMGGHAEARLGAVIVTLLGCDDLSVRDYAVQSSDPYVTFTINKQTKTSAVIYNCLDPKWIDAKFDWFKVPAHQTLKVEVFDKNTILRDELLGEISLDLHTEVAIVAGGDVTKTYELEKVPGGLGLTGRTPAPASTITLRLQWIPFAGI